MLGANRERFNHCLKHFTRVQVGIEKHPMSHQVAAIGALAEIAVHPNPHLRSTEVGDRGRKPRKKFKVNCRIDAKPTHSREDADRPEDHRCNRRGRDGEHVALRESNQARRQ